MDDHDRLREELTLALSGAPFEIVAAMLVASSRRPSWWSRLAGVFRGIVI
jgi:hypothetical protein